MEEINGDTKVILHRLDQQDALITRVLNRQERWQELSEKRLNLCEKLTGQFVQTCKVSKISKKRTIYGPR
jgi:hypothetical protein